VPIRKPPAFILTGAFWVICRNPLYLSSLLDRGIKVLVITATAWREHAAAAMAQPGHPAAAIEEIAFVTGDSSMEGSFTAGAVAAARRWADSYSIVGIHPVGETFVEPTGLLADALGLRSPGLRATRVCRTKYLQRWYMPELSPASVVVPATERAAFDPHSVASFPCVLKPANRHSSSGVVTVLDTDELESRLKEYPSFETLLVEQKVEGQEYSVESLVQDGKIIFASATSKQGTDSHASTFVELVHTVPCEPSGPHEVLHAANRRMLELLAFENGIAHSEWRVDAAGRAYLMEVASRTPGDGLMALYRLATGSPMEPEIIRITLGEHAAYPETRRYARQVYLEHTPGKLKDVIVDWPGEVTPAWIGEKGLWPSIEPGPADDAPALRAVLVLKDRDDDLTELTNSDDRAVTILIDAATPEELDVLEQQARDAVRIVVE
jgi:ATP-grasp domain-containing protein